jgi:putative oxidoreductase
MKLIDLFKTPPLGNRVSIGLLLLRFVVGLAFMFHGWDKIKNPFTWMGPDTPAFLQALAATSEFVGGFAWIVGLLTPLASFGLTCTMAVAVWFHAIKLGDPFASTGKGGAYEPAAVYLCVAILLLLAGPGKFSLDRALFGEKGSKQWSRS